MFLHTYHPEPIMFSIGPLDIHWYGFIITCGVIIGFLVSLKLARQYKIKKDLISDLYPAPKLLKSKTDDNYLRNQHKNNLKDSTTDFWCGVYFWLIIFGVIGARAYHVLCKPAYYFKNPLDIIKIWNGGLGIYGAVIAGMLVIWIFSKRSQKKLMIGKKDKSQEKLLVTSDQLPVTNYFWLLLDILAPALALGEAFGRWGNYFNQEVYGIATSLPWGIPIDPVNRFGDYRAAEFFHPTFLYQSLINFLIFGLLIWMHGRRVRGNQTPGNSNIKHSSNQAKNLSFIIPWHYFSRLSHFIFI